jgi:hypothetical protein
MGGADWLKLCLAGALVIMGCGALFIGGRTDLDAVTIRQQWSTSADAQLAEREATASQPIWLAVTPSRASTLPPATIEPLTVSTPTRPQLPPTVAVTLPTQAEQRAAVPTPETPVSLDLLQAEFQFLDPPEPGAHARLSLELRNNMDSPTPPIDIALTQRWMAGFKVSDSMPPLVRTGAGPDGLYRLVFAPLSAGMTRIEINLVATGESIDAPSVIVEAAAADSRGVQPGTGLWRAKPPVVAPKPRPGPVMALRIPKLGMSSPVVPTSWEPPPFVVGEIAGSAPITEGNTVLVGHLTGAAGAVFGHLEDLEPGDELVAVSRGVEYPLVVTDTFVQPQDNIDPSLPGGPPRLTLVTCAGDWDPITRNYSDRLWVVAEPPPEASPEPGEPQATTTPTNLPTAQPTPSPVAVTPTPVLAQRTRGLGDPPATFAALFGAPSGQSDGDVIKYRSGGLEYEVHFGGPRGADSIAISAQGGPSMTLETAVQAAHNLFPPDSYSRIAGTDSSNGLVIERMTSAALPGRDFVAAFARQADGSIRRVVVSLGDAPQEPTHPSATPSRPTITPSPSARTH